MSFPDDEVSIHQDELEVIHQGLQVLTNSLEAVESLLQRFSAVTEPDDVFRAGWLAAVMLASLERTCDQAARNFEEEWPTDLIKDAVLTASLFVVPSDITAEEQLTHLYNAFEYVLAVYQGVYQRFIEEHDLQPIVAITDQKLEEWLAQESPDEE